MSTLRIILLSLLALALAPRASAAPPRSVPSFAKALVQIRVDETLADSTGTRSLRQCNPSSGSLSTLRSPRYTDDGGLLLSAPVAPDVKVPNFAASFNSDQEPFAVALRMRIPRGIRNYAPLTLVPASSGAEPLTPFIIDGDSIRMLGAKRFTEPVEWWSNPLPQPDADGYTNIVYHRIGNIGANLFFNDRLYDFEDNVPQDTRYSRVVINPADGVVLNDLVIFNKDITRLDFCAFGGFDRSYKFKYGEVDDQGTIAEYTANENAGYKRWIVISGIMIVVSLAIRLRRPRRHVVCFRFVGFPLFVLAIMLSITVQAAIYQHGGVTLEFWKWVACLAAYIVVAWAPLDREEYEKMEAEEQLEKQPRKGKSVRGRVGSMLGRMILGSFFYTMAAFEGSKRDVVTVNAATGQQVGRSTTHDVGSFFSSLMAGVVSVFAAIAILGVFAFLLIRLVLWIFPWITIFFFVINTLVYILMERNIDLSRSRPADPAA